MSDRDRSEFVALVAVACTVVVYTIGLWSGTYYQSRNGSQEKYEAARGVDTTDVDGFWLSHSPASGGYEAICDHPSDKDQADLCQQWRSATAAEEVASYGWLGLFFTILGLIGLGGTVFYARHTLIASRRIGQAQVRAYITVHDHGMRHAADESASLVGYVLLKNTGQSPARQVRFRFGFYTGHETTPPLAQIDPDESASVRDIGANGDYELTQEWDAFMGAYRREIIRGERTGWMHGVVEYRDVFDELRHTWFTFGITQSDAPIAHPDQIAISIYVAEQGNQNT